jgi:ABC-type transport system involved in cytochrome bd biosynthesis fused ATPase/permease subunit
MIKPSSQNSQKQIWPFLTNKSAFCCFALLTLQQIIEASSTVWLVLMMKRVTSSEPFLPFLFIFLSSLIVPYFPGCIAMIIKISWKQESQRAFIQTFVSSNRNQISEWSNKKLQEEKLSILTSEGPSALHLLIDYVYDLYSYLVSVIFNIIALSVVVEPMFAAAYSLSVFFVILVMMAKRRVQKRLTQKALTARIDLYQSLLAAWDNVLIGNFYNYKLWQDRTTQRVNRCLQRNVELERFDQILAIIISLITSIPSLAVVVVYAYLNRSDIPTLSAFIVTLPVLFYILSYTYGTLSLIFRWSMHRSKLFSIFRAIQPLQYSQDLMENKVKWGKIKIVNTEFNTEAPADHVSLQAPKAIDSYQELLEFTNMPGRITLRGENGAGKSTLLMLVKDSLAERAFFLPTHNHLSFLSQANKYSTGESLKNRLLEILDRVDVDVLLLDEWDANLDQENRETLSSLIDKLSMKKCVIEVRHR